MCGGLGEKKEVGVHWEQGKGGARDCKARAASGLSAHARSRVLELELCGLLRELGVLRLELLKLRLVRRVLLAHELDVVCGLVQDLRPRCL